MAADVEQAGLRRRVDIAAHGRHRRAGQGACRRRCAKAWLLNVTAKIADPSANAVPCAVRRQRATRKRRQRSKNLPRARVPTAPFAPLPRYFARQPREPSWRWHATDCCEHELPVNGCGRVAQQVFGRCACHVTRDGTGFRRSGQALLGPYFCCLLAPQQDFGRSGRSVIDDDFGSSTKTRVVARSAARCSHVESNV